MYRISHSKRSSAFSVQTSTGGLGLARSVVTTDTALGSMPTAFAPIPASV